jgi:1,2-phenylacetyl-CoA epoxidase catalytic subunit
MPDWSRTIARHYLYETADQVRIEALKNADDAEVAGLAAKIDREETYHRMHADMWLERLRGEQLVQEALVELWPYALGVLDERLRPLLVERVGVDLPEAEPIARNGHTDEWPALWEEMTMVRRSVAGAKW